MILCARDIAQGSVVSCALVFLSRPETRDRSSFVETLSLLIEFGTTMEFFTCGRIVILPLHSHSPGELKGSGLFAGNRPARHGLRSHALHLKP